MIATASITQAGGGEEVRRSGNGGLSAELKQRLDRICSDFIESRADIEEGAVEAQAALEAAHNERLWAAACWRDYQLSVAEKTFASETAQIETEFASDAVQLRDSMLSALLEQKQALLEEKERLIAIQAATAVAAESTGAPVEAEAGQSEPPLVQSTTTGTATRAKRSLRSAAAGAKKDEIILKSNYGPTPNLPNQTGIIAPKRTRTQAAAGTSVLGMSTLLPEYEIYDDLNAISRGGPGEDGSGRRNAPRTFSQKTGKKRTTAQTTAVLEESSNSLPASSPAKQPAAATLAAPKKSMKDLSAPADESISADEQHSLEEPAEVLPRPRGSRKKSVAPEESGAATSTPDGGQQQGQKRKNSAEDKYISIEPSGAFYYCGCKYTKGATFDMAFGRDLSKTFQVVLLSAAGQEIQVKKVSDGSKIKVGLEDLISGSVMILASQE